MNQLKEIETRREQILEQLRQIRSLQRGTINQQYLKVPHKGKPQPVLRGPYYVLSRNEQGKTISRRLSSLTELEQAQRDLAAHRQFSELCREYEQLTERLGELERAATGESPEKKRRRSPSSRTRK